MARTVAPLLSFDARGKIGDTLVYSEWKGRPYSRRYVVPANPKTTEQTVTRTLFSWLNNVWKFWPGSAVAAWQAYADASRFTDRNGFIKQNLGPLRGESDLTNITISPSARSGLVAAGMTPTPGSSQISIALTAPALPAGWTIEAAYAAAIRNQDPNSEELYTVVAASDPSTPYTVVLTGLTPTEEYVVGAWFEYNKPDGTKAYGRSLQAMATPTA